MSEAAPPMPHTETATVFEARSGEVVAALEGTVVVPERRGRRSRTLELHYVRFPSTSAEPGPPVVYLAGGPGGSGVATARGRRFPLFMAMREFGDVIALDQRGTGRSTKAPGCPIAYPPPHLSSRKAAVQLRAAVRECGVLWREQGFDPRGFTTVESARDLDDLRVQLGAEKLVLWGISYGTHLALAAVKTLGPSRVDRMILASAEGLGQTVKRPARTDAYFGRLQTAIDAQPAARAIYPDVAALMRRVHARLAEEPVSVESPGGARFLLTREVMRTLASASIADPAGATRGLSLYLAVEAGKTAPVGAVLARYAPYLWPTELALMPTAMDIASGIDGQRLRQVRREAKTALLGDVLNAPMPQLRGTLGVELGDAYRAPPRSDVPTLLLSGTLDGRTYPESQQEAVRGLSKVTTVTVVNGGHNLFMVSPEVTATILRFMRGELTSDLEIRVPAPSFVPAFSRRPIGVGQSPKAGKKHLLE